MTTRTQLHVEHYAQAQAGWVPTLDDVLGLVVLDRDLTAAPGSPTFGGTWIVAGTPAGGDPWENQGGKVARWFGAWAFFALAEGQRVWIADEDVFRVFDGTNLVEPASGTTSGVQPIARGGTGQTSQTAAMDALSPSTTKGDLLVDNGTNVVRLAVGSNAQKLQANSAASAGVEWADEIVAKSVTINNPGAAEDVSLFHADKNYTITKLAAVVRGTSPSATWTVRKGSDRSAAGTEVVTSGTTTTSQSTGSVVTSFNSASIAAGDFVWLETTAVSGTIVELHVTVHLKRTAV